MKSIRSILWTVIMLGFGCTVLVAEPADTRIVPNTNQGAAGVLQSGILTIRLEAATGEWYPEENEGPALEVAAFRERGGTLSTPGPLLRVPEGTEIHVTVYNHLDQSLTVHGLHTRPGDANDVLLVPAGGSRELQFLAGAHGNYFYWASRNKAETVAQRRAEDGQLNGALVVDSRSDIPNAKDDRILMITGWLVVDDDTTQPPKAREVLGINGLSWPHTERLTYRVGESVHWRVINASVAIHPMHLHGFYFRVDSVGDAESETTYGDDQRRMAVTELLRQGRTFSLTWTPDRSGNWVFHCHVLPHISPERRYWQSSAMSAGHNMTDHAREGMAGLVMGITVLPADGPTHKPTTPGVRTRNVDLVATEVPGLFGKDPGMAFALANGRSVIKPTIPGPPILLTQG
jgi:FtsP/CotA-like multicopper oxidase with cupredoxin domain